MLHRYVGKICSVVDSGAFVQITVKVKNLGLSCDLHHTFQIPHTEFDEEKFRLYREVEVICNLDLSKPILNG